MRSVCGFPRAILCFWSDQPAPGKSTLLKLLYRDLRPTTGDLRVLGFDLTRLPARDIPRLRRQMGIVLQDYGLLPQRTVWENVAYACQVLGQGGREIRQKLPETLELVGMMHPALGAAVGTFGR